MIQETVKTENEMNVDPSAISEERKKQIAEERAARKSERLKIAAEREAKKKAVRAAANRRERMKEVTYEYTSVDHTTGEVTKHDDIRRRKQEPQYVKLYIDTILTFKGLSKSLNPILVEFLKTMRYSSSEDTYGGQIVYTNKQLKEDIAKDLGYSVKRIEQALSEFVTSGVFKRIGSARSATYQVNPYIFGKGDWKDILALRNSEQWANFDVKLDFITGEVQSNIKPKDDIRDNTGNTDDTDDMDNAE